MKAGDILAKAAETYRERNKLYGNNYHRFGSLCLSLFPNGMTLRTVEDFNRFGVLVQILSKQTRYAEQFAKGGHLDSIHDTIVYAAMLEELDSTKLPKNDELQLNVRSFDTSTIENKVKDVLDWVQLLLETPYTYGKNKFSDYDWRLRIIVQGPDGYVIMPKELFVFPRKLLNFNQELKDHLAVELRGVLIAFDVREIEFSARTGSELSWRKVL